MSMMMSYAQSYDMLWKAANEARRNGLPQTAVKHAEAIFRKAEAEKNPGQMLKAYVAKTANRGNIDTDNFFTDLKELERWASTADAPDRSILHTLIAYAYSDYARRSRWNSDEQTNIVADTIEDIRAWDRNMFIRRTIDHTLAALEDSTLLAGLSSEMYVPFVEQRPAGRYFNHNLYYLLSTHGIYSLQTVADNDSATNAAIIRIYSNLKRMYGRQGNDDALLLLALDELEWRKTNDRLSPDAYRGALDELIGIYGDRAVCIEAYLAKARSLTGEDRKVEAYGVCRDGIRRHPGYERIRLLENVQKGILEPSLLVRTEDRVYPGDTLLLNVSHANTDGFTVHYYKVNLPATSPALKGALNDRFYNKYAGKIRSEHFGLVRPADYLRKDTVFRWTPPGTGIYAIRIVPDDKSARAISELLSVTALQLLSRGLPDNRFEVVTLDARSGRPIEGAAVRLLTYDRKTALSVKTGADGRVVIPRNDAYRYVTAGNDADASLLPQGLNMGYYGFRDGKTTANLTLLTDRSIYRPGQTVHVKGVAYSQSSDTTRVIAGKTYALTLLDVNGREVSRKELTTNEYGSFAATFILPQDGLNGMYTLRTDRGGSAFIQVEEYKRPTFDITIDQPAGAYRLNDAVTVTGSVRTYSGTPVQDMPVRYVVTRRLFGWREIYYGRDVTTDSGAVSPDDEGRFALPVVLTPDEASDPDDGFYTFTVSVTVTNMAGETQTSTVALSVGNRSLLLSADVPERIDQEEEISATFGAVNLNRKPVEVEGAYRLYRYSNYITKTLAEVPTHTGTFVSNIKTMLPEWKSLPAGAYKFMLTARDEHGREATYETEILLFSAGDTRPIEHIGLWYRPVNTEFDASHPGEFLFGTSEEDAYVLMDVFSGNRRLESRSLHLSDTIVRFAYPYQPEYGDGLTITFCYVKNSRIYTQEANLRKRLPEKELKLSRSVFRDKLRPGQAEEWKLTVTNPDGSFADAELLAVLYDASLDKIRKLSQDLRVGYSRHLPSTAWQIYRPAVTDCDFVFVRKALSFPSLAYDTFSWFIRPEPFGQMLRSRGLATVMDYATPNDVAVLEKHAREGTPLKFKMQALTTVTTTGESLPDAPASLRTNFAETAFFYPQLRTNENGEVTITFTVPESLTRWNFNGYAHTGDMATGRIDSEVVTSKEFMLIPNLPRFVRVGDRTSVAASVANLTGDALSGNVVLTLFDPLTEKVVAVQKQKFTAAAGKTAGVNFLFTATDKHGVLGCRIIAEGGSFSDGEQHLLPVLSRKERVIETVAMPVRGGQTRTFPLTGLFNKNSKTATGRSLTVEFSGNPVWYAIQALPSLSLPVDDNAVSWATAYYANALAAYIMNAHPRLKAVVDAWKKQGGTGETFLSHLQKNQDVKNILLEESPWVMEAITEQEQKERLVTLFDLNTVRNNTTTALNKLKALQLSTGAWTWYKGMPPARSVTTYVMQSLVRLKALTGQSLDPDAEAMYRSTFAYLHREALEEYAILRKAGQKEMKAQGLSAEALRYLYIIALSGEPAPKANEAAYRYFLEKIKETLATQSITGKALAAIVLHKAGRSADARAFIASLMEYAVQTDERGMFFAFNEHPYAWAGLRVPSHVAVMEAFDLVGDHPDAVEEMKLWLLKEKQTRQWNSPVATANAVYALLYRGADPTQSRGDVRITVGDKILETLSPATPGLPGMAYVRETITDKGILSKARTVVVEKRDAGMAWGAAYAQYEEETDNVASHGEGLNIDRKLYVERITGNRKELLPVASGTSLKVGDKVVSRITIRLDRSMDFVQMVDRHAACLEPVDQRSTYIYRAGAGYYMAVKDAATHFYFDTLNKGVHVLEHSYRVSRSGVYATGSATIQSAFAPEYASHTPSITLTINSPL
jgi:hypothetical protein